MAAPSAGFAWTLTALAVAVQAAGVAEAVEPLKLPVWIVTIAAAVTLGARMVLYVREIASDKPGVSVVGGDPETWRDDAVGDSLVAVFGAVIYTLGWAASVWPGGLVL